MSNRSIFKIEPTIQTYAWGGHDFIPKLIGQQVDPKLTYAELWMGDHIKSPARIANDPKLDLNTLIQSDPNTFLGKTSIDKFGTRLPFLFKVLDVNQMLSIQSHPNKFEAEAGFKREEQAGVPLDSFTRTFKDDNHKPELMVAISPFWLLHGFRPAKEIKTIFQSVQALKTLEFILDQGVIKVLEYILRTDDSDILQLLQNLSLEIFQMPDLDRSSPHFWVKKALVEHGLDRGVIFIYLLNLVYLDAGQAIFQAAGVPHAYLEGRNIEIMANSDNVLRGGLTKKHTNVDLLLDHLIVETIIPEIISGKRNSIGILYPAPVDDFSLYKIKGSGITHKFDGASILLVYSGDGVIRSEVSLNCTKGDVIYICPNESLIFEGDFAGYLATSIM